MPLGDLLVPDNKAINSEFLPAGRSSVHFDLNEGETVLPLPEFSLPGALRGIRGRALVASGMGVFLELEVRRPLAVACPGTGIIQWMHRGHAPR